MKQSRIFISGLINAVVLILDVPGMGRKKPRAMKTINEENTGETKTVIEKPVVEENKNSTNGSVRKENAAEKEEAEQIIKKISVHEAYGLILQNKDNENFYDQRSL